MAAQQQVDARSFNKNVQAKSFVEGDWVLRKVNMQEINAGKLVPTWEGPYQISKVVAMQPTDCSDVTEAFVPRC